VNLRENAGSSTDAVNSGPRMVALAAAAAEPTPDVSFVGLESEGIILVYGRDERAIEAGNLLKDHLDVTVLLPQPENVAPPRVTDFPTVKGTIRSAKGHLGAFEISIDGFAVALPSSSNALTFGAARDGATSRCDILLDVSGGVPLFPAADLRDGYLRADPRSACPAGALLGDPERPMLRFVEDACVQCGLCKATCPEKVINLIPRIDFGAATASAVVLKEEEPFPCIRCGKPFGVRSTIERVLAKLDGKHWMYQGSPSRLDVIKMCENCRVAVVTEEGFDPYGALARPKARTTADYLREPEKKRLT
jgi:NAD-dependent dihydropyrimidine dehydrogenase PreA subunit